MKCPIFGLGLSLYVKIGLSCSVFVCTAVVEFAFGVVEKGMTGGEPNHGNMQYVVMWGFVSVCEQE
jgi:hypothetical protein